MNQRHTTEHPYTESFLKSNADAGGAERAPSFTRQKAEAFLKLMGVDVEKSEARATAANAEVVEAAPQQFELPEPVRIIPVQQTVETAAEQRVDVHVEDTRIPA